MMTTTMRWQYRISIRIQYKYNAHYYGMQCCIMLSTGIGSMGAQDAGAPMKFLSGTHTKSHFALKFFYVIDLECTYGHQSTHLPNHLPTPMYYRDPDLLCIVIA